MKLPALLKPRTPTLPVADWIDRDAVQALQHEATAALAIDEPMTRLVALKAADSNIQTALKSTSRLGTTPPLTIEGKIRHIRYMSDFKTAENLLFWANAATAVTGLVLLMGGAAIVLPALKFAGGALVVMGMFGSQRLIKTQWKNFGEGLGALRDVSTALRASSKALQEAIADIEANATLSAARQSPALKTALALSPSLEERFIREAGRAAIGGPAEQAAPATETRAIPKPIRRDMGA